MLDFCVTTLTFTNHHVLLLYSATKYIGGHSDILMGCVVTADPEVAERIRFQQFAAGGVPSPFDCYLALRGLKTLHVRMDAAQKNAHTIAEMLSKHEMVDEVLYPGLTSHPQHDLAKSQASGFGAMVSFFIKGGIDESAAFLRSLKLFILAESLGAVESLAGCPAVMTHASIPREQREAIGISDNLIRLSIGIEHQDDLLADLNRALNSIAAAAGGDRATKKQRVSSAAEEPSET
jgi:cystathionine gamma-lyase